MQIKLNTIGIIFSVTFLAACQHDANIAQSNNIQAKTTIKPVDQWQEVTVRYHKFEDGFYGLVSATGKNLLPMNLTKKYLIDGTELRVRGHEVEGMMSTHQWGTAFKITDVELIKMGKDHHKKNNH